MPHEVSDVEFNRLVAAAIEQLPERFRKAVLEDVPVQIAPHPTRQQLAEFEMDDTELLLGLYEGFPLPDRMTEVPAAVPDRIWLFKDDIEDYAEDEQDLIEQVRITLLHELGHYFGLDEDDLEALGYA